MMLPRSRWLLSRLLLATGAAAVGCKGPERPPPSTTTAQIPESRPEPPGSAATATDPPKTTAPAAGGAGAHGLSMCTSKLPASQPGTTGGQGEREVCIAAKGACAPATDPSILPGLTHVLSAPIVCAVSEPTSKKGADGDQCCYPIRYSSKGRAMVVSGGDRVADVARRRDWGG